MRCDHTDWVCNRLAVSGPPKPLATLRAAAAGAGVTPWAIDYDRLEEDLRVRMIGVPRPRRQTSLEGCRLVARQLRDFVRDGQEQAIAAAGLRRHVPFDLHSLIPVPWDILRLGDEDPRALAWLWAHWGTTWTLRRVSTLPWRRAGWQVEFWSADWTPWPAIRTLRGRYPDLTFDLQIDAGSGQPGSVQPPGRSSAPRQVTGHAL